MVAGYLCDRNGLVLSDIADHKTDWKDEKVINAGKQIQELPSTSRRRQQVMTMLLQHSTMVKLQF